MHVVSDNLLYNDMMTLSMTPVVLFKLYFYLTDVPFNVIQEHRRLTCAELARLQGFESGELSWKAAATPLTARGHQVGNSMSVPVLTEAMRAVLHAANLL